MYCHTQNSLIGDFSWSEVIPYRSKFTEVLFDVIDRDLMTDTTYKQFLWFGDCHCHFGVDGFLVKFMFSSCQGLQQ